VVATLAAGQSASGAYYLELTATEVANLGWITVNVQATNARQYYAHIQVMAYDPYDVVRIGLTSIPNVAQGTIGALPTGSATGQVTVATNNDKTGYSLTQAFPTNFSSMAITAGGAVTAGTVSDKTGYSLSGTQTFNLTGSITGNLSGSVGSVTGAVGSVTGNVGGNVTGSIGSLTATAVQNIWDDATTNNTVVGSIGKLVVDNLNAPVGNNTPTLMWSNATRTLTAGTNIVLAKGTGITGFNDITATNVWSETLPGSYTSNQAGFKLNAAGSSADPWSTSIPGAYSAGTAGFIIGNNLNATITSRMATFTLPTNFSSMAISGTGAVTAGTVSDKSGYSLVTAPLTGAETASAVWNALLTTHTTSNSFGQRIIRGTATSPSYETFITGSNHIACDVHDMQPNVLDASALATDAVTEITKGIWNEARATASPAGGTPAVGTFGYYLDSRVSTAGGGGGGSSVTVRQGPFTMQSEQDTISGVVEALVGSDVPLQIQVGDGTGTPVPLSGTATINLKTYNSAGTLVETAVGTLDYGGLGYISATFTPTTTATAGRYTVVAEVTDGTLIKYGGLQLLVKGL
jgi:hypothetical protein